jgi:hypothetical protein
MQGVYLRDLTKVERRQLGVDGRAELYDMSRACDLSNAGESDNLFKEWEEARAFNDDYESQ